MVWAYIENGADAERTVVRNERAFDEWCLRQRVLRTATASANDGSAWPSRPS